MKLLNRLFLVGAALLGLGACGDDDKPNVPSQPDTPPVAQEASSALIYQANPRMFASRNCLDAITARVPEIAGMDATILYVMPIYEPGVEKSVNSPYCIKSFTDINARYGSKEDLRELVTAAHSAGLKVMLDWVANHASWDNTWVKEHPDWFVRDAGGNMVSPNGWSDVVQLNFENASLRKAMTDAMVYWVREFGIDGYRCDFADGPTHQFWQEAITALRAQKQDIIMFAESKDTGLYKDGFDMVFGWGYGDALKKLFAGGATSKFFEASASELSGVPQGKSIVRYVLNHDVAAENDIATLYGSVDALPAAYCLTTMMGGTPMFYVGMESTQERGKMNFFNYSPITFSSTRHAQYAAIDKAYRATADLREAKILPYETGRVATFVRTSGSKSVLVMVNTDKAEQTARTPITLTGAPVTDLITGTDMTLAATVTLPGYGYKVMVTK